jgi:hypothetical protein
MLTPAAKAMAEKLGLKMGRANLDEFAATLEELARANPNIIAVTSDSRSRSSKLASPSKTLSASRPGWQRAGKSPLASRRLAFSQPARWSRSKTIFVTRTFRRCSSASAPA